MPPEDNSRAKYTMSQTERNQIFEKIKELQLAMVMKDGVKYSAQIAGRLLDFPVLYNDSKGIVLEISWGLAERIANYEVDYLVC